MEHERFDKGMDLSELDKSALLFLFANVTDAIKQIETQLDFAKSRKEKNQPIDNDWWNRARGAKRHLEVLQLRIPAALAALKKREKAANIAASESHERRLIQAMREHITPEQFRECVAKVEGAEA